MAERSPARKPPSEEALEAFYRAVGELLLKASEGRAKMAAGDRPKARRPGGVSLRPRAHEMIRAVEDAGRAPGAWRCSPDLAREVDVASVLSVGAITATTTAKPNLNVHVLTRPWGPHPLGHRLIGPPETFLGLPITVDEQLPPNSLILDPA